MQNSTTFRLGTRGSDLALWQTGYVRDLLQECWPELEVETEVISTKGDQILDAPLPLIGGKGLFTAELETALHNKQIDAAVHSLKDLPTENPAGITVGAIPQRANPADVLVSRQGYTLETLPNGAAIGTSSRRRAAQLLHLRPDLKIIDIRGNVPTRIRKALNEHGPYEAIVLAYAGLERLDRLDVISQVLTLEKLLPAPGQGALGIQCRNQDDSLATVVPLNDQITSAATTAERSFLSGLGGGCAVPVAAIARVEDGQLTLQGRVSALDGSRQIDVQGRGPQADAPSIGAKLALEALDQGAATLLEVSP